jgi:hypothetical protein
MDHHVVGAVHLVPERAGELLLVEERSVGADESNTGGTVPPIIAHPVHLNMWLQLHTEYNI